MIDVPPPPGPPLSAAQRRGLESLFDLGVTHFRDLEAKFDAHLPVIGQEMERLVASGLDYWSYALQELDRWVALFSSAARRLDMSAAMAGRDTGDVTKHTIARIASFVETFRRMAEQAQREECKRVRADAIEFARAREARLAKLLKMLRDTRRRPGC